MEAANAKELAALVAIFGSLVEQLGAKGIFGLLFGSPVMMVMIFSAQAMITGRRLQHMFEEARQCVQDLWEKHRNETNHLWEIHRSEINQLQETHRQESAAIVKELGEGLKLTTRYYENNVMLVEDYSKLSNSLQDLVVTNVRSLEKVAAGIETMCKAMGNK